MGVGSGFFPVHGCSLVRCVPSVSAGDQNDLWKKATEKNIVNLFSQAAFPLVFFFFSK